MAKKYTTFKSSAILSASWDEETRDLDVIFKSGRQYSYPNVPQLTWNEFRDASSPGQYFVQNIRRAF